MAKRAKVNLTVNTSEGQISFEKGKVYADEVITKEIDASNFETVSDEAIENDEVETSTDGEGEGETKKSKRTKKTPGEDLE